MPHLSGPAGLWESPAWGGWTRGWKHTHPGFNRAEERIGDIKVNQRGLLVEETLS